MNERFKFRVWDKRLNRYLGKDDPTQMLLENGNLAYLDDEGMKFYEVEFCIGLKDKNGELIHDGDWLKTKDGYYCYVVWFDGFWWVKSLPSEAMDLEPAEFYKECEVIGNIHENADLLENEER